MLKVNWLKIRELKCEQAESQNIYMKFKYTTESDLETVLIGILPRKTRKTTDNGVTISSLYEGKLPLTYSKNIFLIYSIPVLFIIRIPLQTRRVPLNGSSEFSVVSKYYYIIQNLFS